MSQLTSRSSWVWNQAVSMTHPPFIIFFDCSCFLIDGTLGHWDIGTYVIGRNSIERLNRIQLLSAHFWLMDPGQEPFKHSLLSKSILSQSTSPLDQCAIDMHPFLSSTTQSDHWFESTGFAAPFTTYWWWTACLADPSTRSFFGMVDVSTRSSTPVQSIDTATPSLMPPFGQANEYVTDE